MPRQGNQPAHEREVEIEDGLMHPLVSGPEAKRYETPRTDTYILFPYEIVDGGARLIPQERMATEFPRAWSHLVAWREALRAREGDAFVDATWWRFGRTQNLDKQDNPKILTPRLVVKLACTLDIEGKFYTDNVDVGGVVPARMSDSWFLLGVLNGAVASWVFRRISKPFEGGYRSANKQFIAPLPVPRGEAASRARVGDLARSLQDATTRRRDAIENTGRRLGALRQRRQPDTWLWPDLDPLDSWIERQPPGTDARDRQARAEAARAADVEARLAVLQEAMTAGAAVEPGLRDGTELVLRVGGRLVVERVFVDPDSADLVLAQWRHVARTFSIAPKTKGKDLANALRTVALQGDDAAARQVVELDQELVALEAEIASHEAEMEALLADLYGLTGEERALVRRG